MIINKRSGRTEKSLDTADAEPEGRPRPVPARPHDPAGTLPGGALDLGKVVEYDADGKEIWSVAAPSAWAAVRLKNGNTLISGNQHGYVREVNRRGEIVWEINKNDLPGIPLYTVQEVTRLANGNTLDQQLGRQRAAAGLADGRPVDRGDAGQEGRLGAARLDHARPGLVDAALMEPAPPGAVSFNDSSKLATRNWIPSSTRQQRTTRTQPSLFRFVSVFSGSSVFRPLPPSPPFPRLRVLLLGRRCYAVAPDERPKA